VKIKVKIQFLLIFIRQSCKYSVKV